MASNNLVQINKNGGLYVRGKRFGLQQKIDVVRAHCKLTIVDPTKEPTLRDVAAEAQVSIKFTNKVLTKFKRLGYVTDPAIAVEEFNISRRAPRKLGPEELLFLLALRAEADRRPLYIYVHILKDEMDCRVSYQTISNIFKKRFEYRGSLRKSSFVPLDKYKAKNIQRYYEFLGILNQLPNHSKFHWINEKHVVNHHCVQE